MQEHDNGEIYSYCETVPHRYSPTVRKLLKLEENI